MSLVELTTHRTWAAFRDIINSIVRDDLVGFLQRSADPARNLTVNSTTAVRAALNQTTALLVNCFCAPPCGMIMMIGASDGPVRNTIIIAADNTVVISTLNTSVSE